MIFLLVKFCRLRVLSEAPNVMTRQNTFFSAFLTVVTRWKFSRVKMDSLACRLLFRSNMFFPVNPNVSKKLFIFKHISHAIKTSSRFNSSKIATINEKSIFRSYCSETGLKTTCLHEFHVSHGGKMVPFAGYSMPVQYGNHGIATSHLHTREHVSIFDVSHMLQSKIHGKDRIKFMESLVVADIEGLKENQGTLTLYTNVDGGIIDDLIVTKTSLGYLYVVSNAGCTDKDLAHVKSKLTDFKSKGGDAELEVISDHALVAVQGPAMAEILQPFVSCDLRMLTFMMSTLATICDVPNCRITRCGYTGEDGVELSIPNEYASHVVEELLKCPRVLLAGLGARDTLRLEAGLCLYGNDISESITPVEAGLVWTIGKKRREKADFPGAAVILKQLKEKPSKKRIGLISNGPPARAHTPVVNQAGEVIGEVTSGCPSPCLKSNVAMAYVQSKYSKLGTELQLEVRKKLVPAQVTKMPFVPTRYFMGN